MLAIQSILHPTDFSENSGTAFDLACALAKDYGARLVVMHVAIALVAYNLLVRGAPVREDDPAA